MVTSKDFPSPRPGEKLEEYMPRYTRFLTKELYSRMAFAVNFLLSRLNDQRLELVAEGNTGEDQDGNFKIIQDGDDWIAQIKSSGTWTTVWKFKGS